MWPFKPRRRRERPGWDEYFLGVAVAVSQRADCCRRAVGAVLVDSAHIIRATGYNGSDPGGPSCLAGECARCANPNIPSYGDYTGCIERHAEDNAVRFAWRGNPNLSHEESTMYITCAPCTNCQALLWAARVGRVVYPEGVLKWCKFGGYLCE